jgi:hypothetical protein
VRSVLKHGGADASYGRRSPRLLDIFAPWRLQVAGYTLAAVYAAAFFFMYRRGDWFISSAGKPIYNDFTNIWLVTSQALHGNVAALYDPVKYRDLMATVLGVEHANARNHFYPIWPYPPIFFLLAPLATLPYITAFIVWEAATLLGCVTVVFLIARKAAAIALALASPFTAFDLYWGQSGFLRTSLVGAALLMLERRPVLAGAFIGCLTYKPQFGILFPIALVAARQWRAFASAAITAMVLAGASIAECGIGPWEAFPRAFAAQTDLMLLHTSPESPPSWVAAQTVYGLIRTLQGSAAVAWLAQGCATAGIGVIVWLVWRSPTRYALKAALLSAGTLLATPYAWAHDFSVIAVPIAFLASDQMRWGLLRGEQTILVGLFAIAVSLLFFEGWAPLGPAIVIPLVVVILRRVLHDARVSAPAIAE